MLLQYRPQNLVAEVGYRTRDTRKVASLHVIWGTSKISYALSLMFPDFSNQPLPLGKSPRHSISISTQFFGEATLRSLHCPGLYMDNACRKAKFAGLIYFARLLVFSVVSSNIYCEVHLFNYFFN